MTSTLMVNLMLIKVILILMMRFIKNLSFIVIYDDNIHVYYADVMDVVVVF